MCHVLGHDVLDYIYLSHVLDFLSGMFDEGHGMLTVQLTVQNVL